MFRGFEDVPHRDFLILHFFFLLCATHPLAGQIARYWYSCKNRKDWQKRSFALAAHEQAVFLIRTGLMGSNMSGRDCEKMLQPDEFLDLDWLMEFLCILH